MSNVDCELREVMAELRLMRDGRVAHARAKKFNANVLKLGLIMVAMFVVYVVCAAFAWDSHRLLSYVFMVSSIGVPLATAGVFD